MAAPRATQFLALRNLARGSHHQIRRLSMTGPKTFASPILERPVLSSSTTSTSTSTSTPLHTTDRPPPGQTPGTSPPALRHFNTSRELKANKDSSTIDFAFLPDLLLLSSSPTSSQTAHANNTPPHPRVPVIFPAAAPPPPHLLLSTSAPAPDPEPPVMRPEISALSADACYLPLAESSDGHAMQIDFHAMAETVAAGLRRFQGPVEARGGMVGRVWGDMVDDLMGVGKRGAAAV